MTSRMGSYDIFLNSKDSYLKHESLDILDGDCWSYDDDKFLESIRYGDKLMDDDELLIQDPEEQETEEMVELESSELLTYAVGEEAMSGDSASSPGSCASDTSDDRRHDFSVVELVGILPSGVKTFQIVQQEDLHHKNVKILNVHKDTKVFNVPSKKTSGEQHPPTTFQELKLSDEERRLLSKEGITMPSHYPLTKSEERELKRIRRKIRNKISAQDSRKRKKEFVDTLQQKMQEVEEEKSVLNKKVRTLELVNARLSAQVKKLQTTLANFAKSNNVPQPPGPTSGNSSNVMPAATTLLVLILSLALVVLPTMDKASKSNQTADNAHLSSFDDPNPNTSICGRSRTMMDIASSKDGISTSYEVDGFEVDLELDSEPLAKIPRFSLHQVPGGLFGDDKQNQHVLAARLQNIKTGLYHVYGGKKRSFQVNQVNDELD